MKTPFLILLAPLASFATPLSLDDIARIRSVAEVAVSPNGEHVAFVRSQPRDPFKDADGGAWRELLVISGDRGARRFVHGEVAVSSLAWSPDNRGIFYLSKREGDEQNALRAIPVDGGESLEICALDERSIAGYSLSPDGSSLAIRATLPPPEEEKKLKEQGFKANVVEESVRSTQIYLASIDEETACEPELLELPGSVIDATFSPTGDRLLVKLAPTPHIDDQYMKTRMRVVDLEGSVQQEIENLGKLGAARWSPDGTNVAFIGVADHNDPREGQLKIADAASGTIRNLTPTIPGHVIDIAWQNDESVLALVHLGVESEVWSVDVEGESRRVRVQQGDQVVHGLAASADGKRIVALADSPSHPRELFDVTRSGLERLTDSNPWLKDATLGRQETVRYAARDGLDVEGLLIYPTDYTEGSRYPLIIFVHGGPEAHRSDGWLTSYSNLIQHAAGQGYFSFVPNYRGSTGRGVEFSKLHQHNYAYGEFDDIVDGKNHLVDLGLVDADSVGITGGSYGGYATAWSATALTEHYAAGVMFVGISNQISKFGTTDIPNEMYQVHSRAWPWDDWQWMLERSPVYHVEKSKTPLLIMHGDADPRVHPSQSLEMYRYLKQAGQAPVRLVYYPGEKHGNRKAAAQYDYSVRLMRWMDHYLKGEGGAPPSYEIDYSDRLEEDEE